MEAATIGMIIGLKTVVVFGAFLVILYFAVLLCRVNVPGSRFLLGGGVAILVAKLLGAAIFDVGRVALWPSLFLEAVGTIAAAYGFARLARDTIASHLNRK
jgi:hypothetical protein